MRGGALTKLYGLWADEYNRSQAVLLNGHRALHTVLPLRPDEIAGLPMVRFSGVMWTKQGADYPPQKNWLAFREAQGGADSEELQNVRRTLRTI